MVVRKRKKVTKYRAKTTHGGGHRKKRRGAGSRGGRGNAGTGKRAGHKVAGLKHKHLGKKGFNPRRSIEKSKSVNVGYFTSDCLKKLVSSQMATLEGQIFTVDLNKLGYTKLLGTGSTSLKLKLSINKFTPKAEQKITAAGGSIQSTVDKKEEVKTPE